MSVARLLPLSNLARALLVFIAILAFLPFINGRVSAASLPAVPTQNPTPTPTPSVRRTVTQAQAELYDHWRSNLRTNQRAAYEAGQEYLSKYGDDEYAGYVRKWVSAYERASRKLQFQQLLYKEKRYTEAYALGKLVLADDPDNLHTLINLASAGYLASSPSNESFRADALEYAKQATAKLEAGQKPEEWQPFAGKTDALGFLNFIAGELVFKDSPADAINYYLRAIQFESSVKSAPDVYARLAAAYVVSQYQPLARDYEARYSGKVETPESRAALEKIYPVLDLIIDAYARAVALSGTNAKYHEVKTRWVKQLTEFYKSRHQGSTDGLDALIANIPQKPIS